MFSKSFKRHGHGHGHGHHKKMHKYGGKHEEFGHHFKHPGHHMGKEFFKWKHHRGLDFERGCFSESELPDTTTQNVSGGPEAGRCNLPREFYEGRHHWRYGRCCCEKNVMPTTNENTEPGEKSDVPANTAAENVDSGQKSNVPGTSAQNVGGQDKTKVSCHMGRHCFRHHGGRGYGFNRPCQRCAQKKGDTTEEEAATEGERDGNIKKGYLRKHYGGHHKGKRGHGFRKPCQQCFQEDSATENEDNSGDHQGVQHGYIRKHHRGHHGSRREGRMFKERHHGGKWGHGPHKMHHRGWRRHGCCILMVDAAVNTGESESELNAIQEIIGQENSNPDRNMDQDANEGVSQEQQAESGNVDQVLEVADNLRKSSLE